MSLVTADDFIRRTDACFDGVYYILDQIGKTAVDLDWLLDNLKRFEWPEGEDVLTWARRVSALGAYGRQSWLIPGNGRGCGYGYGCCVDGHGNGRGVNVNESVSPLGVFGGGCPGFGRGDGSSPIGNFLGDGPSDVFGYGYDFGEGNGGYERHED